LANDRLDLKQYGQPDSGSVAKMVNERAPSKAPLQPIHPNEDSPLTSSQFSKRTAAERRSDSSWDDDSLNGLIDGLKISSSQPSSQEPAHSSQPAPRTDGFGISRPPIKDRVLQAFHSQHNPNDPFHEANQNRKHVFGRPSKVVSSLKQKAANVFIHQTSRPEHHRDHKITGPSAPVYQDKKADSLTLYSSASADSQPAYYGGGGGGGEIEIYTDPNKVQEDLKALFEGGMDEEEDEQKGSVDDGSMEGLKVKLLPHQVEGVEWMRGRELGPVKKGKVPKGGILADDMGLGKTLQTISLILSNQKPADKDATSWKKHYEGVNKTTLVVAPLALIRQWEQEIKDKVTKTHALKVCVHHGPQRTKNFKDLAKYDVVITTYQILVSEHGHSTDDDKGPKVGCFGLHWWRVVLDEAHTIKNRNAKATKACYALRSEYRWCLSGTPMQNNLEELQSLVKFLRIKPYDDLREWKEHIEKPIRNGKGHIAIRRLHSLLRCFMKRRTKAILKEDGALNPGGKPTAPGEESTTGFKVTERKIVSISAKFSPAERRFYSRLEQRTDKSIEKMLRGKVNYANALVLLLRLRQACNHPKLVEGKLDKDRDALSTGVSQKQAEADVDSLADMFGGMSVQAKTCTVCGRDLSYAITKSGRDTCQECYDDLAYFNSQETAENKRPKKSKIKKVVKQKLKAQEPKKNGRRPRVRNAIIDSDDEEADASWLVPEDQRGETNLGKAGGEEDEDAEGGGDWIGSEDSDHDSEKEDDGSQLDSFIVNDEESKVEVATDSDDSLESISALQAKAASKKRAKEKLSKRGSDSTSNNNDSEYESCSENDSGDSGIEQTELPQDSDDDQPRQLGGSGPQVLASAKIRELVKILHGEVHDHKFIVFSQFTSMLDLIEPFFRKEAFKFTRYDGSMRNDEREASLDRLRNDSNTRILLCSLKCGSLGLNLTAATRVVILEPFWNPVSYPGTNPTTLALSYTYTNVILYSLLKNKLLIVSIVSHRLSM
jgi:SNF2 family DNA or RNA helicase